MYPQMQKKPTKVSFFGGFNGRSTRIRTLDPLVPNQVRYQTAPHSDKIKIIARIWRGWAGLPDLIFAPGLLGSSAPLVLRIAKQDIARLVVGDGAAQVGQELRAELLAGANVDGDGLSFAPEVQAAFLEHDVDLVAIRCGPGINLEHQPLLFNI
jgi:hypothetical protein